MGWECFDEEKLIKFGDKYIYSVDVVDYDQYGIVIEYRLSNETKLERTHLDIYSMIKNNSGDYEYDYDNSVEVKSKDIMNLMGEFFGQYWEKYYNLWVNFEDVLTCGDCGYQTPNEDNEGSVCPNCKRGVLK